MQISDEMVEKALEAYHATDDFLVDKIRAALEAALAGHVVVPVEPTDAMLDAAMFAVPAHSSARDADKCMYIAMINASPPVSRGE